MLNVVVEDSQTGVVRQTSVDCSEPVNSLVFVHLVAFRVELKCVVTARTCKATCIRVMRKTLVIVHMKKNYYLKNLLIYIWTFVFKHSE